MAKSAIAAKVHRLERVSAPRTLDLFASCGGLSAGFQAAGFALTGAVESDPVAIRSYARNFHRDLSGCDFERFAKPRDIRVTSPAQLARELQLGPVAECVDVIIGGPPCQAFARVGRAKLREIAKHPQAYRQDDRSNLYLPYLDYVRAMQPLALLMENVPDVLNYGGHNIADEVAEVLGELGYECRYTLLNAAYFGVPQMRERMFLLAFHRELRADFSFPQPTHWVDLPRGYESSRNVALRTLQERLATAGAAYVAPPRAASSLPPATTTRQAISDLPPITAHLNGGLRRGTRRFTQVVLYPPRTALTPYANLMRSWPDFESPTGVADHVIRCVPRDYRIFKRMRPGDQYPQAHQIATRLLEIRLNALRRKGEGVRPGTKQYESIRDEVVPPYDPKKFPNKWRKMEADAPARTLMAHLGKDSYSHIHYDSVQARTISVREAARLQSFPDGFVFEGTMNPAFRQIGNAVPPLLANALAHAIADSLGLAEDRRPLSKNLC